MVASLIDEGSGDLDSNTYHERLDRPRPSNLISASARDTFRGSLRMLKDNKDEAFELLRTAADIAAFRQHPMSERHSRADHLRSAARHPPIRTADCQPASFLEGHVWRPPLWPGRPTAPLESIPKIDVAGTCKDYVPPGCSPRTR